MRQGVFLNCGTNYFNFSDFESKEFLVRLAYLSDIFEVLNNFNMSFQGSNGTLF